MTTMKEQSTDIPGIPGFIRSVIYTRISDVTSRLIVLHDILADWDCCKPCMFTYHDERFTKISCGYSKGIEDLLEETNIPDDCPWLKETT